MPSYQPTDMRVVSAKPICIEQGCGKVVENRPLADFLSQSDFPWAVVFESKKVVRLRTWEVKVFFLGASVSNWREGEGLYENDASVITETAIRTDNELQRLRILHQFIQVRVAKSLFVLHHQTTAMMLWRFKNAPFS